MKLRNIGQQLLHAAGVRFARGTDDKILHIVFRHPFILSYRLYHRRRPLSTAVTPPFGRGRKTDCADGCFAKKLLTNPAHCAKITKLTAETEYFAELCNGSTADSDSVCEGSNPSSAASREPRHATRSGLFLFQSFDARVGAASF